MTNYESIPYNDKGKFAEWLSKLDCVENMPWIRWVDDNYCKRCEPITDCYPGDTFEHQFSPCELGGCPYGVAVNEIDDIGLIKLWFEAESN